MDPDVISRRQLIARTAKLGLAMGLTSSLSLVRTPSAEASVLRAKGYNDGFLDISQFSTLKMESAVRTKKGHMGSGPGLPGTSASTI